MAKQSDFDSFLNNIEPSQSTVQYISEIQTNLRNYLKNHDIYKTIYVDTFLSGSYAKHTSIRPVKDEKKRDVDIVLVTSYDKSKESNTVLEELCNVLKNSKDYNCATVQHHSVGVEMAKISIDVVPVIENPDDNELYYIGDNKEGNWTLTDPKGHKAWSTSVNQDNDNKYKPLVKIFKWWRRFNCPNDIKYPKGITLEKLIADNLGDASNSMEDFLIETMENLVSNYKETYADLGIVPSLDDPSSKIDDNNVLEGYTSDDFKAFIYKLEEHLKLLNDEGTENDTWRKILGTEFPRATIVKSTTNSLVCQQAKHREKMPWCYARGGAAFVFARVKDKNNNVIPYVNNGEPLPKGYSLEFKAITGVKNPFRVVWQITNTGYEAQEANCLRGKFEQSDIGTRGKREATKYSGSHSIQCFIIKNGVCVAKSQDFIINIQ